MNGTTQAVVIPLALYFVFALLAVAICMRASAITRKQFIIRLVILCVYALLAGWLLDSTN